MTIQLTPTQQAILTHAHQHTEGKIAWFPENIKGGARQKVIDGLFKRTLITYDGKDWFVAAEGYEALGVPRKAPVQRNTTQARPARVHAPRPRKCWRNPTGSRLNPRSPMSSTPTKASDP
mgnify:CR=1 FL=1